MGKIVTRNSSLKKKDFEDNKSIFKVAVNVNRVYLQIAKYRHNPYRKKELILLGQALTDARNHDNTDRSYVVMTSKDVKTCFGDDIESMPKNSFLKVNQIK